MAEAAEHDLLGPRHASHRLAELLAHEIDTGRFAAGDQLPSYRQLASEHGIAVNTAQAAIRLLAAWGRVVIRPSSGAFVAEAGDRLASGEPSGAERSDLAAVREQVRRARTALADAERALDALLTNPVRAGDSPREA